MISEDPYLVTAAFYPLQIRQNRPRGEGVLVARGQALAWGVPLASPPGYRYIGNALLNLCSIISLSLVTIYLASAFDCTTEQIEFFERDISIWTA